MPLIGVGLNIVSLWSCSRGSGHRPSASGFPPQSERAPRLPLPSWVGEGRGEGEGPARGRLAHRSPRDPVGREAERRAEQAAPVPGEKAKLKAEWGEVRWWELVGAASGVALGETAAVRD